MFFKMFYNYGWFLCEILSKMRLFVQSRVFIRVRGRKTVLEAIKIKTDTYMKFKKEI